MSNTDYYYRQQLVKHQNKERDREKKQLLKKIKSIIPNFLSCHTWQINLLCCTYTVCLIGLCHFLSKLFYSFLNTGKSQQIHIPMFLQMFLEKKVT